MLKLGRIYVIDFQDARTGPIQYDLVSLVHDSYVNLWPESIDTILEDYKDKAEAVGPKGVIRPDFDEIFKLQTIQRCFKACGSFTSFFNMRKDTRYLKYIKNTATLVAKTLAEDGRFKLFRKVIDDAGLADRDYEQLCAP